MQKNNIKTHLHTAQRQVAHQISRIDKLLSLLNRKTTALTKISRNDQCQPMENTGDDFFCLSEQTNPPYNDDHDNILDLSETQSDCYQFKSIWYQHIEEIDIEPNWQYDPTYIEQIQLMTAKSLQVETKFNWITNYLDQADCKIELTLENSNFQIVGAERGKLICQHTNKQTVEIDNQSLDKDTLLNITFPSHLQGYHLKTQRGEDSVVYELTIHHKTRILLQILNTSNNMSRVMLVREVEAGLKYEVVWGNYSLQSFIESLIIEPGKYILLPLCQHPHFQLNLYYQNIHNQSLKADLANPLKTYTLLSRTFDQCADIDPKTARLSSTGIRQQFIRSCHMDLGLIIEIYQNIHKYQALFTDHSPNKEDLTLLFPQIYTPDHLHNRLKPGQKVLKFYGITLKPARLFVPKKFVRVANRIMDNITIHSIFQ